ncbi:polyketide antibiotic transporter [Georgenia sp. 10Sc9-8]|uniref:Polyketide antibiotic transporter n=1 Tax=Georgenia halotolerans TaxID=3028317 RepID=A0ABT5U3G9_9MICO|nr:polyketide antibiotic transporter [Georgenia halotolerans]
MSTAPAGSRQALRPWAGTRHLLRLALRRDRVRIPVWVLALAATAGATVPALEATYAGQQGAPARGALTDNPAGVLMLGPSFGERSPSLGAMTVSELGMTLYVATAVMAVLLTVRHTRAEEEAGRVDVVRALAVGRFAPAAAALGVTFLADLAVAVGIAVALVVTGLPVGGSAVFAASVGLVGTVFGAVAAVAAQLARHPRGTTGLALSVLAAAFALRGVGDVLDPTDGSWLSWLSPLAWAQQTRVFVDTRLWPLALLLAATSVLVAAAALLGVRRDLGSGLLPERRAPDHAGRLLHSAAGLAWRQLRSGMVAWGLALAGFAAAFGSLTEEMNEAVEQLPEVARWMAIAPEALTDSFAAVMLLYLSLGTAAFVLAGVLALVREEESGTGALVVVAGTSRTRWMGMWLVVTALGALVVQGLAGLALGVGVAVSTGEQARVGSLTVAALGYLPGVLVLGGVAAALVGWWPRAARPVAWVVLAHALLVAVLGPLLAVLGPLLQLPDAVINLSPLQLTPAMPLEAPDGGTLVLLLAGTLLLGGAGMVGLRRRDLAG